MSFAGGSTGAPSKPSHIGPMNMPLHEYLQGFRERGGVKQEELAKELQVHVTVLSQYENGKRKMPSDFPGRYIEAVRAIARKHAKDVDAL